MNRSELISGIADKCQETNKTITKILDAMLETIGAALKQEDEVRLVGFGTFKVTHRQARTGRHPRTGEEIQLAASKVASFKPGKELKEVLNGVSATPQSQKSKNTTPKKKTGK